MNNAPITEFGTPPIHVPEDPRAEVVFWCQWAVKHQDRFRYTMSSRRSGMFNNFTDNNINNSDIIFNADCSQYASSLLHKVGVKIVTKTDYTGTLLEKGKLVESAKARPGDVIIFGPGTGTHAAFKTYNRYCIGFGHWPGAPNRTRIADMANWFKQHGHPGVRYLSFLP